MTARRAVRAWKCQVCRQLTLRTIGEDPPGCCDNCQSPIDPFILKRRNKR